MLLVNPLGSINQAAAEHQAQLQHSVSVTLKLIHVYVTDKSGRAVPGLKLEDFTVVEDGKPVRITDFESRFVSKLVSPTKVQPSVGPAVPPQVRSPVLGRKYILLIDFAYNTQRGVAAALEAALHFIDAEARSEDTIALVSYSALKGLKIHEFLTQDRARVRRALTTLTVKEITGRAEEIEQLYWMAAEAGLSNLKREARYNLAWRRQEAKSLASNYLSSLTSLAKAMRLIDGRKHILYFSTGIPYSLIYGAEGGSPMRLAGPDEGTKSAILDTGDIILRPLSEEMLKEFSASDCSLFAFDTRESAKVPALFAYEETATDFGGRTAFATDGVFRTTTDLLRDDRTTGMDVLRRVSKQTGGRYYSNIGVYKKNLAAVQRISGSYYVLGFPIRAAGEGKFHHLKVDVKRKGCRVQAQAGYFEPKPFMAYSDLEKQIHLFDIALNENSEARIPRTFNIAALSFDPGGGPRLRVLARIPKEILREFAGQNSEIISLVFDQAGNPVGLQRTASELAASQSKETLFTSGTTMAPGHYTCKVIIRDMETGASAVATTEIDIAKSDPAALRLFTPLLLIAAEASDEIEAGLEGISEIPSWQDVYPYSRADLSPLAGAVPFQTGSVIVIIPFATSNSKDFDLELFARMIGMADGRSYPIILTPLTRSRAGNLEAASYSFSLDGVPPGKYSFYFYAQDKNRDKLAYTYMPLVVGSREN